MKFNKKNSNKTTNHEGGKAYSLTPERDLYVLVCSSLMEEKFYEKSDEQLQRLKKLIKLTITVLR